VIQGQDRKRNIIQLQLLDVEALNITTNEDYWFVTGDGSRQRGPYRFKERISHSGKNGACWRDDRCFMGVGFLRRRGTTPAVQADQQELCMAMSTKIKLVPFRLSYIPGDPEVGGNAWCKVVNGAYCDGTYSPQMKAGDFLLKKRLVHGHACKAPREWEKWQADADLITMAYDFDGDGMTDFGWCSKDRNDPTRCSDLSRGFALRPPFGAVLSFLGCSRIVNDSSIIMMAPQLFAKPGDCVCSCEKPRCYAGKTNARLQATAIGSNGDLADAKRTPCMMSMAGRSLLEKCCQQKIDRFRRDIIARCNVSRSDIDGWCDGVPDEMEVQIGGRALASARYFNHRSTNACVESRWGGAKVWSKEMDARIDARQPSVSDGPCVDNDQEVKKLSGGKASTCAAVANMCRNSKIGVAVSSHCPKTCGTCTAGFQRADLELDDAVTGKSSARMGWAPASPDTPTPSHSPVNGPADGNVCLF